jgi:hypothetical protein
MACPTTVLLVALAQNSGTADPPWRPRVARVIDGATHVPVAGVEVYWLDREELSPDDARFVCDRELVPEEWIRRLGHHATSDSAGDVALPAERGGRIVVAWHDEKYARFASGWDTAGLRVVPLELEDDAPQLVRVVDATGAPLAGVEVAAWREARGACWESGPGDEHIWSGPTDAKGEARLPHADWFFRSDCEGGRLGDRRNLVGLGFPVRQRRWVGLEARKGDPPAIELVAPPLERRDLELHLVSGERCTAPVWVSLESSYQLDLILIRFEGYDRPLGSWLVRDGRLSLPSVERGLPLRVSYACDRSTGSIWRGVQIPNADPGSTKGEFPVRANDRLLTIRGRAVNTKRHPWADARLVCSIRRKRDPCFLSFVDLLADSTRADSEGRFSRSVLSIDWDLFEGGYSGDLLVALCVDDGDLNLVNGSEARVSIRDMLDTGETEIDVRDIELTPPVLRVAGRVLDAAGRSMGGVHIEVEERPVDENRRNHAACSTSDDQGRFAVHGGDFDREVVFSSSEPGWRLESIRNHAGEPLHASDLQVPLGTSDVELVLVQYGGVRGRVVMPEGMRARDLELKSKLDHEGVGRLDFYPDGTFEARVPSDVVVIEVRSKADDSMLATRKALVPESGLVDDPDFVIDLRPPVKGR